MIREISTTQEMRQVLPDIVSGIHEAVFALVEPGQRQISAYDAMNALNADCQTMSDVTALLRAHGRARFEHDMIIFRRQDMPVTLDDLLRLDGKEREVS